MLADARRFAADLGEANGIDGLIHPREGLLLYVRALVTGAGGVEQTADELGYPGRPLCFKPVFWSGSRGFRILDSTVDREAAARGAARSGGNADTGRLERVRGPDGRTIGIRELRQRTSARDRGGVMGIRQTASNEVLREAPRLDWHGVELQVEVTAEVEDQLVMTAPWMNPFKLGPDTIVGYFKHHGLAETVFTSRSPGVALDAARAAFDEYMSGQPYWLIDTLLNHVGDPGALDFLELGCGTGRYAFELALRGAGDVLGIDIRDHNIAQARYLQRLDQRLNRIQTLRFEHERGSADDPDFLAGRSFDVALMTVFPILRRPIDQMINVATLTRRAALFHLHLRGDEHWKLLRREPDAIVSAFDGWSWEAPARVFPWLLQTVGFKQVIELTHPLVQPLRDSEPTEPSRLVRLLLPGAITIAPARLAAPRRRAQAQSLRRRYCDPAYHTFLALK